MATQHIYAPPPQQQQQQQLSIGQPVGFSKLSEAERQAALSFLLVSQDDPVIDGAWNHDDQHAPPHSSSASSSISVSPRVHSSSSPASESSSRSSSPSSSSAQASSLLIRSKWQGWERSFELHEDWPIPKIERDDEVLIEHNVVGLNPVDFKSVLYNFGIPEAPWVLGRDISGVVAQVGSNVKHLQPGQRVWTCADARNVRAGAYQTYSVARGVHLGRTSERISDERAATLGTGLVTAAIAAYWFFQWPRALSLSKEPRPVPRSSASSTPSPRASHGWVLIYGGGAITGIYIAQLAKLSGLRTIAVASPSNFDYLTSSSVGVTRCVDRFLSEDEIVQQVHDIADADGGIEYVIDCVGSKTAALCYDVAANPSTTKEGTLPAQMICLAGDPKSPRPGKREVIVHRISFSTTFYGDDVFAQSVLHDLDVLMDDGQLHGVQYELVPDGLAGVRRGLERLRDNLAPRACKLIVNVKDTPHAHSTNLGVRAETCWNGVA